MAKPIVVGVTGLPCTGKTEFADTAAEMGFKVIEMGDFVRAHARLLGLEATPNNIGMLADKLREDGGADVVAKMVLPRVLESIKNGNPVVVVGIRSVDEVEVFRREFGKSFVLIGVDAPRRVRFERACQRRRGDDPLTWEEFEEKDMHESTLGTLQAVRNADHMLVNDKSLEEFKSKVRGVLAMVIGGAQPV